MTVELKELREKQAQAMTQARALYDEIKPDTPEDRAKELEEQHDRAMAEFDALGDKIAKEERMIKAANELERPLIERVSGTEDRKAERQEDREIRSEDVFEKLVRFGAASLDAEERVAAGELRANLTPEMRAQAIGTDAAGGYTVPEGFLPEITKTMEAWGPMLDPGVTRELRTATGNRLPWPTVDDTANVGAIKAENVAVAEQDVVFAEKELNAFVYSSDMIKVSFELLQDSAFSMDSLLSDLFGERIGRKANTDLTVGAGTTEPFGIVTRSSLGTTAATNAAITADEMLDLEHSVDPAYRSAPTTRFMFNDSTLLALRKLKDGQGNYLLQMGDIRSGVGPTILGHPYTVNQAMASIATVAKPVLFGDFNKYIVRKVQDFTVLRLAERYAESLQVAFFAYNRFDGELSDTAAVKHLVHPV